MKTIDNSHTLVIAEKPSVGQAIAKVLGATRREDGYMEGGSYIVSWCIGHLIELADASVYDAAYKKWRREDLPIIPTQFQYEVLYKSKKQYQILKKLMHRSDVSCVVNACDAGREGELIMRLVYEHVGCNKPIQRLWISSMEESAIREGFQHLKPGKDYENLYQAALCRAKADYIVGINATRFFSLLYQKTLNIGRVMTPTLSLIVEREDEIETFVKQPFYTLNLTCGTDGKLHSSSNRIQEKEAAIQLQKRCKHAGFAQVEKVESKEKRVSPPALYDLTTLQREANRKYGYTAQQTLDYVQSLYEKKLCTYPRTDSRYLSSHMESMLPHLLDAVATVFPTMGQLMENSNLAQVIRDEKITDHHAIIPTKSIRNAALDALPTGERQVLEMLVLRLFCSVTPAYVYEETVLTLQCGDALFEAKTKVILDIGFQALMQDEQKKGENEMDCLSLKGFHKGEAIPIETVSIHEGCTTPPKRYTEDTLLAAMEKAGSGDAPEDAEHKGIGTPATRAAILEKLTKQALIARKKNTAVYLFPTADGIALIRVLPEDLKSPIMTAEWEYQLKRIESGAADADIFMGDIAAMVQELVKTYTMPASAMTLFLDPETMVGTCPRCGSPVTENKNGYFCSHPDCKFSLWKNNKFFTAKRKTLTAQMASALLRDGYIPLTGCYSEKTGKTYDATAVLEDSGQYVNFRLVFPERGKA